MGTSPNASRLEGERRRWRCAVVFGLLLTATACGGVAGRDGGDTGGSEAVGGSGGGEAVGGTGGNEASGGAGGSETGGTGGATSACPSGEFSETGLGGACAEWTVCPAGTHVSTAPDATTDRECSACAEGTQTLGENESVCQPIGACPAGTVETTPGSAMTEPVCAPCAPGEHCPGGAAAAEPCASGTWDDDGSPATACVPQTVCVPGQFVGVDGTATSDRSCAECENGTFSSTTNASVCAPWRLCEHTPEVVGTSTSDVVCDLEVTQIAKGYDHACALLSDGTVRCWGRNNVGQIGDGTSGADRPIPVAVNGVNGAVAIAAGANHSCALLSDQTVRCWGGNATGQLGDGSIGANLATPVTVDGLSSVVAIEAGEGHTCALLSDGTARCWGLNAVGQLGDGTSGTNRPTPVAVSGLSEVVALSAGGSHTCALLSDATARCWGGNYHGQLGDGTSGTNRVTPVAVNDLSGVSTLSAGGRHTCAARADGAVFCWGYNYYGQLGLGERGGRLTPVEVTGMTGAVELSTGLDSTCAVSSDATALCWGRNVGSAPALMTGLQEVAATSSGDRSACALLLDGSVRCWGRSDHGQIGDGSLGPYSRTPVAAAGLSGAVAVSTGIGSTCGVLANGTARCWGGNALGQLGDGTEYWTGLTPVWVAGLNDAVEIATGGMHRCALLGDGTARCWGYNRDGQLGDGVGWDDSPTPKVVSGVTNAVALSAGFAHSCALLSDGTARCWGRADYGQLGEGMYGSGSSSPTPLTVVGLGEAVALTAGFDHTCALLNDGTVRCWGGNRQGQLGDGTWTDSAAPVAVSGISGAVAIAAGDNYTCALLEEGVARCWGGTYDDWPGELMVTVSGLSGAVALSAGDQHFCVLRSDGTVLCWGANQVGQLGDGTPVAYRSTPVAVSGLTGAVALSAGPGNTCAILSDGTGRCWGADGSGQLGDEFFRTVLLP